MNNTAFENFYDTSIEIESVSKPQTYSGDTKFSKICTVLADVQPLQPNASIEGYGIFKDISYVLYCKNNDDIKIGMCAVINGERFIITGLQKRNLGMKLFLREEIS